MMITKLVTYAGVEQTQFERDRWINMHLPLVGESWRRMGAHCRRLLPKGNGTGLSRLVPPTSSMRPPC